MDIKKVTPRLATLPFPFYSNRERRQAGGDDFGFDPLDPLPSGGSPPPVGEERADPRPTVYSY